MSESRFTALFAGSYGKTPMKFVQGIRLRDAADLLRTSDLPLKAIAARVGYSSRSHLSRVFQTQFGTDPTSYRAGKRQLAGIF
jgi:transcriptional regulator GlxA family with amidase domain